MPDFPQQPNPFERLFDPSNPSGTGIGALLGIGGTAMGVQSSEQRATAADAEVMQELSALHNSAKEGTSPAATIARAMASNPKVMELMHTPGTHMVDVLKKWSDLITPPSPTTSNVPEGNISVTRNPTTGQEVSGSRISNPRTENVPAGDIAVTREPGTGREIGRVTNPNTTMQNWAGLTAEMGDMPPEAKASLARVMLAQGDTQQKSLAIDDMVNAGVITPATGAQLKAGTLDWAEAKSVWNEPIGYVLRNKVDGSHTFIPSTGGTTPKPTGVTTPQGSPQGATSGATGAGTPPGRGNAPAQPPGAAGTVQGTTHQPTVEGAAPIHIPADAYNSDGSLDINKALGHSKLHMFDGSGMLPIGVSYLGAIARSAFGPGVSDTTSEVATMQRNYIEQLDSALTQVSQAGDARLKLKVTSWKQLAPGLGALEDPKLATAKGIQLYDFVKREMDQQRGVVEGTKDRPWWTYPKPLREKAMAHIDSLQSVLDALPSRADMEQHFKNFHDPRYNDALTPMDLVRTTLNLGKSALDVTGKAVQGTDVPGREPANNTGLPVPPAQAQQAAPVKTPDLLKMSPNELVKVDPRGLTDDQKVIRGQLLEKAIEDAKGKRSSLKGNTQVADLDRRTQGPLPRVPEVPSQPISPLVPRDNQLPGLPRGKPGERLAMPEGGPTHGAGNDRYIPPIKPKPFTLPRPKPRPPKPHPDDEVRGRRPNPFVNVQIG